MMDATDGLYITVRGWGMWLLVPGLPRRISLVLGPLCALLVLEPFGSGWSLNAFSRNWNVMATIVEIFVGVLVVVPFLVPVWIAEVVGGMVDVSTNLTFASIVNPLAPGASKGVWSTICRELTFGRLVLLSLFPQIILQFAASVRFVAPGSGVISTTLVSRVGAVWAGVAESLMGAIVPFLVGCLVVEVLVGLVGKFSAASGVSILVSLMKFGLGIAFVCAVIR